MKQQTSPHCHVYSTHHCLSYMHTLASWSRPPPAHGRAPQSPGSRRLNRSSVPPVPRSMNEGLQGGQLWEEDEDGDEE